MINEYEIKIVKFGHAYRADVKFEDGTKWSPEIYSNQPKKVEKWVDMFIDEIYDQMEDYCNEICDYGLLFYACSYDGNKQTELRMQAEKDGVLII